MHTSSVFGNSPLSTFETTSSGWDCPNSLKYAVIRALSSGCDSTLRCRRESLLSRKDERRSDRTDTRCSSHIALLKRERRARQIRKKFPPIKNSRQFPSEKKSSQKKVRRKPRGYPTCGLDSIPTISTQSNCRSSHQS